MQEKRREKHEIINMNYCRSVFYAKAFSRQAQKEKYFYYADVMLCCKLIIFIHNSARG